MKRPLRAANMVAALFGVAMVAAQTDMIVLAQAAPEVTMQVTREAGYDLVRRALAVGNPKLAVSIARQLIAANPDDTQAQVLLTAALSRAGQNKAAIVAGKSAFHAANTRPLRFEAAFLTADAFAGMGRPNAAKWWLRRADSNRSTPIDLDLLQRGFAALDMHTPLRFDIAVNAGPSNNVNGGSLHDSFDFWGIPIPIAQALPGFASAASAQVSYRLVRKPNLTFTLFGKARHREVSLSKRANSLDPSAKNSDFTSNGLDFGASVRFLAAPRTIVDASAQVGRRWSSGTNSDVQRLGFGLTRQLENNRIAKFDLTVESTQNATNERLDSLRVEVGANYAFPFAGGRLSLNLGALQRDAKAPGLAYQAIMAGAELRPKPLVSGVHLEFFAGLEAREYWKARTATPDILLNAGASATFTRMSVMGFSPVATVSASRSVSDVVVRDTFDIGLSIGLSSSF